MSEPEAQKPSGDVVDDLQLFADMVTPYSDFPISHIEQFGLVRFEIAPRAKGQHGGGDVQFAILNEQQSTFLLTLMRNTEIVVRFKVELVKEFYGRRL